MNMNYELAHKMCADVLSVYKSVKMAALHGCCLSWSPARLYGKQTGCTQDMSKMVLSDYSKEQPGQHSDTAGCVYHASSRESPGESSPI